MALLYIDSFDHYQTDDIPRKWTTVAGGALPSISTNGGRCGTQALFMGAGFPQCYKGVTTADSTAIIGFAWKFADDALSGDVSFFALGTGTHTHLTLTRVWNDGSILVTRTGSPDSVEIGSTAPDVIRIGNWYYVEVKVVLHSTAGSVEVRVNGTSVGSWSGIRTTGHGSAELPATWSWFGFTGTNVSSHYIDDVYAADSTAGTVTDFLGDTTVEYLQPIADGATLDWAVTGNADRWSAIDDGAHPDDDTDYIASATVNAVNLAKYEKPTLVSADVYGVQVSILATKVDSGDRTIAAVVRHAAADYVGPNRSPSESNYVYEITTYDENPGTSAQWTLSDVQDAEFGVKVTS